MDARQATQVSSIPAMLMGGPASIPVESRRQLVSPDAEKIKLPHQGGYEHFTRSEEIAVDESVVYYWNTRTRVAE
jgi:hypothetical protein